jgi:acetyl-CoA carboxylase carboxyltransferase component
MSRSIDKFKKKLEELEITKELVKVQHKKGKLTAKERLKELLDEGSFRELGAFSQLQSHNFHLQSKKKAGDGIITGRGVVNKKSVYVYAQDFTFMGGSMGAMHTEKIASVMDMALKNGAPLIGLFDSGGARIQEGVGGLDGGGKIFYRNTAASGIIPQISVIMGPCAGIAVYSPALTDFIFMVDKISHMFITGPGVIKAVTGEKIDFEGLGGGAVHNQKSGVAHFIVKDEKECFKKIKQLLSYLPSNNLENPPVINMGDNPNRKNDSLSKIVPEDPKKSYDVRDVIKEVFDKNSFFEVHKHYAQNAVVGFSRLNNEVVGVVANQTKMLAGVLDINCSDKIARFVRFCDCFNIPLINLVDVSGYLPGTDQEHNGIIRHGAKILYAYSEATVPKISLVMRKAYGGAYIALVSKDMGYDCVVAWPNAEIAVMGAEQAVNIIYRKELKNSKKADKVRKEKVKEFSDKFMNPYLAAESGKVDIIIEPKDTRQTLIKCLDMLCNKRSSISEKRKYKKHGNVPL